MDETTDPTARDALTRSMWRMAGPGVLLWALTLSFAAIDWMMSLQPHWYPPIFGVYYFAGAILSFFSFTVLVSLGFQRAGLLKDAITAEHYHDMGKLVFGYTVFWAYIAFSQFMLIWYANIPEETIFYLVRVHGGWEWISYGLPIAHFGVPFFFLLSRHIKRNKKLRGRRGVDAHHARHRPVLVDHAELRRARRRPSHESHFAIAWTDVTALVGVVGAFLAAFGFFLKKNKVVAINDPRLPESLAHENY